MHVPVPLIAQSSGPLEWASMPDLARLAPGIFLCAWVVVILLVDLVRGRGPSPLYPRLSLVGCVVALGIVQLRGRHAEVQQYAGDAPL